MKQTMLALFYCICIGAIANSQERQLESTTQRKSKVEYAKPNLSQEVLIQLFRNNIPSDFPKSDQFTSNEVYFKVTQGYLNVHPGTFDETYAASLGFILPNQVGTGEPVTQKRQIPTRMESYTNEQLISKLHPEIRQKYSDQELNAMSREDKIKLNDFYYNSYDFVAGLACSISDKDQLDITKYDTFRKQNERVTITLDEACGSYLVLYGLNEFEN